MVGKWAYFVAFIAFLTLSIFLLFNILFGEGKSLVSEETVSTLLDNLKTAIALLIVSVPEGLPLAVSLAMAFSIEKLKRDNLHIKNLASLETAGSLIDIMTGKTATLTEGVMNVGIFYSG